MGFVLYGCHQTPHKFEKEIGLSDGYLATNLRQELNLKNLENGADSVEIRIYEDVAMYRPDRLIIIKNENKIWSASVITYWIHSPYSRGGETDSVFIKEHPDQVVVDSTVSYNLIPKCSWGKLLDSLTLLNIYQLPSQKEIKGFEDHMQDGVTYYFEVATKFRYKSYTYHCPDFYNEENNQNAANILRLISRQLTGIIMCRDE